MPDFEREGVAVFAISYEPVSAMAAFAAKHGITYTLLSDEGSKVIRALGLLNQYVAEQHAYYGIQVQERHQGIPYPGAFVLDANGVIVEKRFEQSYRLRPTAVSLLETAFGGKSSVPPVLVQAGSEELQASLWLGAPAYRPYQKLRLEFEIRIAQGLHVYVEPIPEGYTPLTVEVDLLEGMETGEPELPDPHPFEVEGLDEQFYVYEGTVRGALPLVLTKNLGEVGLRVTLSYQACSDALCYPPAELAVELPITGIDVIRD